MPDEAELGTGYMWQVHELFLKKTGSEILWRHVLGADPREEFCVDSLYWLRNLRWKIRPPPSPPQQKRKKSGSHPDPV